MYRLPTSASRIDFRPFYSSLTARLILARFRPGGSVWGRGFREGCALSLHVWSH
jgi:hypothetical protein